MDLPFLQYKDEYFLHDRHSKYINCRGNECSLDNKCSECESWSVDLMSKCVRHCKSLDSKSKKARKSDEASCSSSVESFAAPSVSGGSHADSGVLTEARVLELISSSFSQLSESLSASMEASFANMETVINDRMSYVSQDVPNHSFTAPSPVPVRQSPCQGRQDPSMESPRTGYGRLSRLFSPSYHPLWKLVLSYSRVFIY